MWNANQQFRPNSTVTNVVFPQIFIYICRFREKYRVLVVYEWHRLLLPIWISKGMCWYKVSGTLWLFIAFIRDPYGCKFVGFRAFAHYLSKYCVRSILLWTSGWLWILIYVICPNDSILWYCANYSPFCRRKNNNNKCLFDTIIHVNPVPKW